MGTSVTSRQQAYLVNLYEQLPGERRPALDSGVRVVAEWGVGGGECERVLRADGGVRAVLGRPGGGECERVLRADGGVRAVLGRPGGGVVRTGGGVIGGSQRCVN
jgi:hypothetical protein